MTLLNYNDGSGHSNYEEDMNGDGVLDVGFGNNARGKITRSELEQLINEFNNFESSKDEQIKEEGAESRYIENEYGCFTKKGIRIGLYNQNGIDYILCFLEKDESSGDEIGIALFSDGIANARAYKKENGVIKVYDKETCVSAVTIDIGLNEADYSTYKNGKDLIMIEETRKEILDHLPIMNVIQTFMGQWYRYAHFGNKYGNNLMPSLLNTIHGVIGSELPAAFKQERISELESKIKGFLNYDPLGDELTRFMKTPDLYVYSKKQQRAMKWDIIKRTKSQRRGRRIMLGKNLIDLGDYLAKTDTKAINQIQSSALQMRALKEPKFEWVTIPVYKQRILELAGVSETAKKKIFHSRDPGVYTSPLDIHKIIVKEYSNIVKEYSKIHCWSKQLDKFKFTTTLKHNTIGKGLDAFSEIINDEKLREYLKKSFEDYSIKDISKSFDYPLLKKDKFYSPINPYKIIHKKDSDTEDEEDSQEE